VALQQREFSRLATAQARTHSAVIVDTIRCVGDLDPGRTTTVSPADLGLTPDELESLQRRNANRAARFKRVAAPLAYAAWFAVFVWCSWIFYEHDANLISSLWVAFFATGLPFAILLEVAKEWGLDSWMAGLDPRPGLYDSAVRARKASLLRLERDFWTSLSGVAFEREVAALLRRLGHTVREIGGAGDEGIDLWCDSTPIQCKRHAARIAPHVVLSVPEILS
jgi:hypothetical protein